MTRCSFHQLCYKRHSDGKVILVVIKTIDDFLDRDTLSVLRDFIESLKRKFSVGKALISNKLQFNGCDIVTDEEGAVLSMGSYMDRIKPVTLSRQRRRMQQDRATSSKVA